MGATEKHQSKTKGNKVSSCSIADSLRGWPMQPNVSIIISALFFSTLDAGGHANSMLLNAPFLIPRFCQRGGWPAVVALARACSLARHWDYLLFELSFSHGARLHSSTAMYLQVTKCLPTPRGLLHPSIDKRKPLPQNRAPKRSYCCTAALPHHYFACSLGV